MPTLRPITDYADVVKEKHALNKTIAPTITSLTAAKAYVEGEKFIYDGILYKTTAAIASGATIVLSGVGANATADNDLVTQIGNVKQALSDLSKEVPNNDAYVLRQGKGNMVSLDLVGGSVAWNQMVGNGNFADTSVWSTSGATSLTVSNNEGTFTPTSQWGRLWQSEKIIIGHKYLGTADIYAATDKLYFQVNNVATKYHSNAEGWETLSFIGNATESGNSFVIIGDGNTSNWGTIKVKNCQLFDLTQMFGPTIADYIYSLEQATAGAGVAWFRKYFSNAYYGYNAGSIQSVNVASRKVYDADNNLIATYDFDSSKTLRGVPQLVDGELQFDGDIYTADGNITRKYGIVDLGTFDWTYSSSSQRMLSTSINTLVKKATNNSTKANIVCAKYINDTAQNTSDHVRDKSIAVDNTGGICIYDSDYSDAVAFTTAMSGVYLVYELATPTTETAEPYQNPQRAFIGGTAEFIDAGVEATTRDVAIPVGNNSVYAIGETLPQSEDYTDGANKALLDTIKAVVADSSDFADFQTKMAAL